MRPVSHMYISAGVTCIFSIWVQSTAALLTCFLSGIFIDLDHHLDYLIARKEIPLSYKKLWDFCHDERNAKMYLILHSYELHILLWLSVFYFSPGDIWLGLAVGLSSHMLADEIGNPMRPMAYFFTYRLKRNFKRDELLKEGFYDKQFQE